MRFFAPDFLLCFFGNAPFVSEQTSFVTAENSWLLSNQVEILNQAIKHHVHCFVFTSSIAVYGSINASWRWCFCQPKGWFTSRRIGSICQRWKMADFLPLRLRGFKIFFVSTNPRICRRCKIPIVHCPLADIADLSNKVCWKLGHIASQLTFLSWHVPGLKEEDRPTPEDPYGIAKYAFELDLHAAKELFGIDFVIFRPHNVYGPHQVWIQKVWKWDWLRGDSMNYEENWRDMGYVWCVRINVVPPS